MPYTHYSKTMSDVYPVKEDTLQNYATRCRNMEERNFAENFQSHQLKHYCHYGHNPCYICPIWTGYRNNSDYLLEIATLLTKKGLYCIYNGKRWTLKPKLKIK